MVSCCRSRGAARVTRSCSPRICFLSRQMIPWVVGDSPPAARGSAGHWVRRVWACIQSADRPSVIHGYRDWRNEDAASGNPLLAWQQPGIDIRHEIVADQYLRRGGRQALAWLRRHWMPCHGQPPRQCVGQQLAQIVIVIDKQYAYWLAGCGHGAFRRKGNGGLRRERMLISAGALPG